MRQKVLFRTFVTIPAILSLLVGCAGPSETPDLPQEDSPTATTQALVVTAEMLAGNWRPTAMRHGVMFLQINADGTCRQSFSQDGLLDDPEVECTYEFEGTMLTLTEVSIHRVPACASPSGRYEVRSIGADQIELVAVEDTCAERRRSTYNVYERIP